MNAKTDASVGEIDRGTHRVEAFSDAFFAIVITLLILDLPLPEHGEETAPIRNATRALAGGAAMWSALSTSTFSGSRTTN